MASKVTLKDVAREAGVSLATASYALNGKSEVGEGTRKNVREVARRLGYKVDLTARAMKTGRTGCIGLIVPNISNPFFATLIQSIMNSADDAGYAVFLIDTEGSQKSEQTAASHLLRHGADGLIWFPVNDESRLDDMDVAAPVVVIDRNLVQYDLVVADFYRGGRLVAEHLNALGHKKIGLLEGPSDVLSARERTRGLRDALASDAEIAWSFNHPYSLNLVEEAAALLARREVTALSCGNDLIAIAAMNRLQELSIRVPEEISVIGFDNIDLCALVRPKLTTVSLPAADIGAVAVDALKRRMDAREAPVLRRSLPVDLVVRDSTAPARPKRAGKKI